VLCITRDGTAPNVRTALYVDGKIKAAFQTDACSWPNAAASVSAGSVSLDNGDIVVWGTLPKGARSARLTTLAGTSVEVPASGDPAVPVFATVASGDDTFRSISALGGNPDAATAVAACAEVQK
jgi:hypothetical protein